MSRLMLNSNARLFFLSLAIPLFVITALDYNSLLAAWNQGRGGFLFAMFFVVLEFLDSKNSLSNRINSSRIIAAIALSAAVSVYLIGAEFSLHAAIENAGKALNIPLVFSWIWLWDYIIFFLFLLFLIPTVFGLKAIRFLASANVYLLGMALILTLDAFFPFDTLGPLQAIVPIILWSVSAMIIALNLGSVAVSNNTMVLDGMHGTFSISVFWPSAGVHSIMIYSLIMFLFLIKIKTTNKRRIIYFAVGAFGTFLINIVRIFSLASYVLLVSADRARFEEFHAVAGEMLFLPWVVVFLFAVGKIESALYKRRGQFNLQPVAGPEGS
ncbi:MAG: thaumarchaeosortase [Thaumarchaeota archaeon]|nr:thaumarchaeosortase [Nitrososphaerota archaeon]